MASREIPRTRRYQMAERATHVSKTRERIVRAAVRLHGEHGIAETSWPAIGKRAGVSTATVYRHFPNLESLIPACAQSAFEAGARLPTASELAEQFAGLHTADERIRTVVRESCRCYELGEGWLDACRREARSVPALAEAVRTQELALAALIQAVVGSGAARDRRSALKALLDFPFWKSLVDSGVTRREAPAIITDLALRVVAISGR